MIVEPSKHTTARQALEPPRQQAEAIIKTIEQEGIAAARVLGFETKSREKLMETLESEIGAWETTRGQSHFYLDEHRETAPREADRVVCLVMITMLMTVRDDIGPSFISYEEAGDWDSACDHIDSRLQVLRRRLVTAVRRPPAKGIIIPLAKDPPACRYNRLKKSSPV
jgi:hypothetical protein